MPSFSLVKNQASGGQGPSTESLHGWLSAAQHLGVLTVPGALRLPTGNMHIAEQLQSTLGAINKRVASIGAALMEWVQAEEQCALHIPEETARMIQGPDAVILFSMIGQMVSAVMSAQHPPTEPRPAKTYVRPETVGEPALKLATPQM